MKRALLALAVLDVVASLLLVAVPYSARGSSQHSNALASVAFGCPQDEGEAVASGSSTVGARARCRHRGVLQLATAGAGFVLAGFAVAAWSQHVVRRTTAEAEPRP